MPRKRKRVTKKRIRRNPAKRRRTRRSPGGISGRMFGSLNFKSALGNMPATQLGMFAAKWCAKRWGDAASETDPGSWNWASYVKGALGAVGAGILVSMLKPSMGQKALEGGLNIMMYKVLQNELISTNDWATGQFGQDYTPDEYLLTGGEGDWFLGEDGNYYPSDERYRLPEAGYEGYGEPSLFGDTLQPVGPLGDTLEPVGPLGDPYAETWFTQV